MPATLVAALAIAPAASALNFVEDFAPGSDTAVNDWIVTGESHPRRATTDGGTGSTGRVFHNDLGADPVTLSQSPALGLSDGTITFDYKDGTGNTPVQLILTDNSGTEALVLNVNSSSTNWQWTPPMPPTSRMVPLVYL